ncbi:MULTISPECIES: SAM-dependent methyltransferase [Vibrio]|uniref:Methyltransferase domain-containing protein n=1 Tax=Vibrio algicola TaxID=2662262 RepID=A0A5Q0TB39_9VIBR|nr:MULTISPECIES: cyclopropane-fatty-acyl-phospholipid synthase family protein [Vibrio]MBD1575774.1 class I SAM-dependent methyltransferase [Vibrio sp. S11_S32]
MDHLAKQSNALNSEASLRSGSLSASLSNQDHQQYRQLIFSILTHLTDSQLTIVEGKHRRIFGEDNAPLKGQITIHDSSFFKDMIFNGSIGAAEAYIDAKWSSPNLTALIQIMARNQTQLDQIESKTRWISSIKNWWLRRQNLNSETGSKRNILAHYDIGNELYQRFLDPSMLYSSAIYSQETADLAAAQQYKMQLICQRLELQPTDSVIEIGTGWGGLAIYMAQHIGCHVTTTTISDAQFDYAQQQVKQWGLEDKITLLKQDYRLLEGQYDKLVSIEMIEAVGHEYLPTFFTQCSQLLKPSGKMLLQSITIADSRYHQYRQNVDFIQKYIFPGGCLPSIAEMSKHIATSTDMVVDEIQDIGLHYARTLNDWNQAFQSSWSELEQLGYKQEFKRLWQFYLCYCEGAFMERVISTHHVMARKPRYMSPNDASILDY